MLVEDHQPVRQLLLLSGSDCMYGLVHQLPRRDTQNQMGGSDKERSMHLRFHADRKP